MRFIGDNTLTLSDFCEILFKGSELSVSENALERVAKSFTFLQNFSTDKIIYGINTGLGPMAQYHISDEDKISLQYNAILSHSAGTGE